MYLVDLPVEVLEAIFGLALKGHRVPANLLCMPKLRNLELSYHDTSLSMDLLSLPSLDEVVIHYFTFLLNCCVVIVICSKDRNVFQRDWPSTFQPTTQKL